MKIKNIVVLSLVFVGNYCCASQKQFAGNYYLTSLESSDDKFPIAVGLMIVDVPKSSILLAKYVQAYNNSNQQALYTIPSDRMQKTDSEGFNSSCYRIANEIGLSVYNLNFMGTSTAYKHYSRHEVDHVRQEFSTSDFTGTPSVPVKKSHYIEGYEWVKQSELSQKYYGHDQSSFVSQFYNTIESYKRR